jgi:uncharacterized protein YecE (DUF72 family)
LENLSQKDGAMGGKLRIGTSGFIYKHWKGVYYPEDLGQKDWFGHYVLDFDTVEINNTFYRLPEVHVFEHWGNVAPPGFLYTFKANRYITHVRRLNDPVATLDNFLSRARQAGKSLGPLLFQLPPRWKADPERLERFLNALPPDLVHVFEFRDASWHTPEIRELLARFGVVFCIHDHAAAPAPEWITAGAAYLRFHGSGEAPYTGGYSRQFLEQSATKIDRWRGEGIDVFVYFNNDVGGYAVFNALTLKSLLG